MMSPELLEELRAALARKKDAKERLKKLEEAATEAKAQAFSARKEYRTACDLLEEIEVELDSGFTGRPLIDAAKGREAEPRVEAVTMTWKDKTVELKSPVGPPDCKPSETVEDHDQVDVASERDAGDEEAIKDAAARFYRPPSKADERPVKPAKGSKRGASPAAVGAAAAATP